MRMKNWLLFLMIPVIGTGCATMDPTSRTIVGSQVGMLAGTVTGAVIGHAAGDIAERRSVRLWDRSEGQFWVLPPLPLKINVTGIQRVPESIRSPIWLLRIFIWKTGITTRS